MTLDVGDPDWVMVGVPLADGSGVAVIASREMSYVELTEHAKYEFDSFHIDPAKLAGKAQEFHLRATMKSVLAVKGVDYLDALRHLMAEGWQGGPLGLTAGPAIIDEPWVIEGETAPKAVGR